ncbi:MAG: hypothetical protein PHC28_01325 [Flavobacterium sp.]|uniref:hypothetical protein n=1 Tax=Flavobacterium sp. TaxID=239 RepID=UPI00260735B8|nr:hypothetical protein [Flavobacterium sp.]MDD5149108.1 hypothetical protein [Flavobacterium sp.]
MKKILLLAILSILFISEFSFVSALHFENKVEVISGTIYQNNNFLDVVVGANVSVTCRNMTLNTLSKSNGKYSVNFSNKDCGCDDEVLVFASKDGIIGSAIGYQINLCDWVDVPEVKVDVEIFSAPLIPEFGLIAGFVTLLCSIIIFLVLRCK